MSVQSIAFAAHNLDLIHDLDAQPAPRHYVLLLHGVATELHAEEGESGDALWQRVLRTLDDKRGALAMQRSALLNPRAWATCYAGSLTEESLAALTLKHMKEFILDGLRREASGELRDSTGASRTAALGLMSRILGLEKPRRRIVTKLTTGAAQ